MALTETFLAQSLWDMTVDVASSKSERVRRDLEQKKGIHFIVSTRNQLKGRELYSVNYKIIEREIKKFADKNSIEDEALYTFLDAVRTILFYEETVDETKKQILQLVRPVSESATS